MLESTFIFLKGVGEATERQLWEHGIETWSDFLKHESVPGIPKARKTLYDTSLQQARRHLSQNNSRFFGNLLKSREHWRLFETFRNRTAFLDIETTGMSSDIGEITVVGIYGKGKMKTFVQGENLHEHQLNLELAQYDLLVTFFGSGFDLPYIRAKFPGVLLDHAHFDLCFAARRFGYKGGLKQIELQLGFERSLDIEGLTGWDAVRLWQAWCMGDSHARTRLLEYNEADTRNLEPLAEFLFEQLVQHYRPGRVMPT